jgi:hypothetical protein
LGGLKVRRGDVDGAVTDVPKLLDVEGEAWNRLVDNRRS